MIGFYRRNSSICSKYLFFTDSADFSLLISNEVTINRNFVCRIKGSRFVLFGHVLINGSVVAFCECCDSSVNFCHVNRAADSGDERVSGILQMFGQKKCFHQQAIMKSFNWILRDTTGLLTESLCLPLTKGESFFIVSLNLLYHFNSTSIGFYFSLCAEKFNSLNFSLSFSAHTHSLVFDESDHRGISSFGVVNVYGDCLTCFSSKCQHSKFLPHQEKFLQVNI